MICSLRRVLGDAIAERPVFLLGLDQADDDVLAPQAGAGGQVVGEGREQAFLLVERSALVAGDLNDDEIVGIVDSNIVGAWTTAGPACARR